MNALAKRLDRLRARERIEALNDSAVPYMDRHERRQYVERLEDIARGPRTRKLSTVAEARAFAKMAGLQVVSSDAG